MNRTKLGWNALQWTLLLGVLWTAAECKASSGGQATKYDSLLQQRPRFKIPRGNLAYYRNPQWEILYYLKFGTFPVYTPSAPYLNRTEYVQKVRQIKTVLDESSRESDINLINTLQAANDGPFPLEVPLSGGMEIPLEVTDKKLIQDVVAEVYLNSRRQRPMHFTRKRVQQEAGQVSPPETTDGFQSRKSIAKSIRKPQSHLVPKRVQEEEGSSGSGFQSHRSTVYDYIMLGKSDPDWIQNRVTKQVIVGDFDGTGGSAGLLMDSEGDGFMNSVAESIERKNNRKFQTQGWK